MVSKLFDQIVERRNSDSIAWSRFGTDVLPLWVADMDFLAPPEIVEAIKKRADHGVFGYGDSYQHLRELYALRAKSLFDWNISASDIKCVAGILPIFYFLICQLAKQDESVLLFTPAYPPFFKLIRQSGRELIEYQLKENIENSILSYSIDFDELAKKVTAKTKVLALCSPHNPVGKVFSRQELESLASFCLSRGIKIISDEIHSELIFEGSHIPTASISEDVANITVTLSGPTKTFNLPGLKVGHVIIQNQKLRNEIFDAAAEVVADVSPVSAAGAIAAYEKCSYWKQDLLLYLRDNRVFAENFIRNTFPKALFTSPQATYLTWIEMSAYSTGKSPFELALTKGKVAVGAGKNFGDQFENYIRISLASPRAMLNEGLNRLANIILS